jgi:hypothetical protein
MSLSLSLSLSLSKNRDSSALLEAARLIASLTTKFAQSIRTLASGVANVRHKDRLLLCSSSLRDFCQQLRILASVKATSDLAHLDRDEQLVSLTGQLVKMWKETSDTVIVSQLDKTK